MSGAHRGDPADPTDLAAPPAGAGAAIVALWALPALYAHGLRTALLAAGTTVVTIGPDPAVPAGWPRGAATTVVATAATLHGAGGAAALGAAAVVEVAADAQVTTFAAAITAGASGVLSPQATLDHAVQVITAAAAGLSLIPAHVAAAMAAAPATTGAPQVSDAERSWLRQLGAGVTVAALAASAACSEGAMYRRLSALYARLGTDTRTRALLNAQRWGLLDT